MKTAIYILLNLIPCLLFGQDYPKIDTLNYGGNVSHVKCYYQNEGDNEILLKTCWFNELGKHTISYVGYGGFEIYKQSKISYNYDINGNLDNIKHQDYISPQNDSIGKIITSEIRKVIKNGSRKKEENVIEKTLKKYESNYISVNPENINWNSNLELHPSMIFKRNLLGKDSLILMFNTIGNKEMYLDEVISFIYDGQNRLKGKKWIDITQTNVFEFQAFKPSSVEFEDSIKNLTGSCQEKTYKYFKDSIIIKYNVNGCFMGSEINKTNDNGILSELVFNANGDTLSYYQNLWDLRKNLKSRKRIKHTGYDGFGYSLDLTFGNIKKYKYDEKDRLVQIDTFEDDKHVCTERFEIIEK